MTKTKKETKEDIQSTSLVIITPEEQAYLESIADPNQQSETSGFDKLTINTKSKDADGNKRVIGSWCIGKKNLYFDGVATFRPVRYAYKLIRYNVSQDNTYTVAGQSIYFNNFSDEIYDSLGGLALGRTFGNSKNLTPEQRAANRKLAETYLDIFGFVKFDDEELHPVVYRVRGGKLKKMLDAFKALPKDKRYSQYEYAIETFQVDGPNPYWDIKVTPDMSQVLPITPILPFDNAVTDYIRESNNHIITLHEQNRANKVEEAFTSSTKASMVDVTPKSKILDDEIPF